LKVLRAIKKKRYILYSGAVRAGKSLLLAHVAIRICIENPGCVGMLGSLTTPQLTDVIFRVFMQELEIYQTALDKAGIPITLAKVKQSKGDMKANFWNGSTVMFKACDDELKLRGLTLDFAGLDEPIDMDETIFKQLIYRISGTGKLKSGNPFILLTTNPGPQSHWIYKRFFKTYIDNPNYYKVETTTYDNVLLPRYEEFINEAKEGDEDWVRRFLDGTWEAFAGQVYKEFNPKKCVGEYVDDKGKPFIKNFDYIDAGVDLGFRNPSCILTIAIRDKEVYVLDEYYQKEKPTHYVASELEARHKRFKYKKAWCDPSDPDFIFQAKDLKVPADKGDRDKTFGIGKIKSIIKKDHLHIDKRCVNLIREFQVYQYKKDKIGENVVEVPAKLDDHSLDALKYGLTAYKAFRGKSLIGWVRKDLWDF
jgi:PBSX family phage terminase large subunit